MIKTAFLTFALGIAIATATASPGGAGFAAYLSRSGSGTACTFSAPCTSAETAIAVAGVNGEVICLDKGGYTGSFNISFSVTISCSDGLWENPFQLITINTPAGSDVVI